MISHNLLVASVAAITIAVLLNTVVFSLLSYTFLLLYTIYVYMYMYILY